MMKRYFTIMASLLAVTSAIAQDVRDNGWGFHRELLKNKFNTSYWKNVREDELWRIRCIFVDMEQDEVGGMNAILISKRADATRFLGYYSSAYSNHPNWSEPPSTNINGYVVSAEMWSTITLYNGAGGIPGQTTPTSPVTFYSQVEFVPATGKWKFHTNSYNPNYVRDVLLDSELQEVE